MTKPDIHSIFGDCDPVFEKLVQKILNLIDLSGKSRDAYNLSCDAMEKIHYEDNEEECWAILKHYEHPTEVDWDDAEYRFLHDFMRWTNKALEGKN